MKDTYLVVDARTGDVMGSYKTLKSARNRADRLDTAWGGVRYIVKFAPLSTT